MICKGCGQPIKWIKMQSGKSMPVDIAPVRYWADTSGRERIVTEDGEVVTCRFTGDPETVSGEGYISHFSTCRKADDFRRD